MQTAATSPTRVNGETAFIADLLRRLDTEARAADNFIFRLVAWLLRTQILQQFEDAYLLDDPPAAEHRDAHRAFLTALMAYGDLLAAEIRDLGGLDRARHGVGQEDFDATVELLRMKYACWHVPMSPTESDRILREVFGVVP